jgi:phage terminase small subunit
VKPKDTAIPAGASDEWAKNLDDKERLFVEGYLQTLNKRQAAEHAGYTYESSRRWAYDIFNRPHVREAIEHLLRTRTGVTKTWLIDKLVAIVGTDLADVADWDESGELVFKAACNLTDEQKVAVSEIIQERTKLGSTLKIKLYDKLAAMGHLAKLLNMLVDRQEISGPDGGPVEVTDHKSRIMDRLNAIAKRTAPANDGSSGSA